MTLHCHKVDDRTYVEDGSKPLPVPAGWHIADGNADDVRVCGAHAWQSDGLFFANGDIYKTAAGALMYGNPEEAGAARDAAARRAAKKIEFCLTPANREKVVEPSTSTGCARCELELWS